VKNDEWLPETVVEGIGFVSRSHGRCVMHQKV